MENYEKCIFDKKHKMFKNYEPFKVYLRKRLTSLPQRLVHGVSYSSKPESQIEIWESLGKNIRFENEFGQKKKIDSFKI